MCVYMNITNSSSPLFPDKTHKVFTAAHQTLPLNSIVEVFHKNKTVQVQVKERLNENSRGGVLFLSSDAAKEVGIELNESSPCALKVPAMKNCIVLRNLIYIVPSVSIFLAVFYFKNYFTSFF